MVEIRKKEGMIAIVKGRLKTHNILRAFPTRVSVFGILACHVSKVPQF